MINKVTSIALIGKNRIGLVSDLTKYIYNKGANIQKSRMVAYDSNFIISLEFLSDSNFKLSKFKNTFKDEIATLNSDTIIELKNLNKTNYKNTYEASISISLSDTPGIIHKTTQILSENNININELRSDVEISGFTNTPLFKLDLDISVPNQLNIGNIYNKINLDKNLEGIISINKI